MSVQVPKQTEIEQQLAHAVFQLGCYLQEETDRSVLESAMEALHTKLDQLLQRPQFRVIRSLFELSKEEMRLLAFVYIETLEPECIGPYFQLSWIERSGMLSLERCCQLIWSQHFEKSTKLAQLQRDSSLLKWRLLLQSKSTMPLLEPVFLAPDVFHFLLSDRACETSVASFDTSVMMDPLSKQRVHSVPLQMSMFLALFQLPKQPLIILSGENKVDQEAWVQLFVDEKTQNGHWFHIERNIEDPDLLRDIFRQTLLSEQTEPIVLDWPSLIDDCRHHPRCKEVLFDFLHFRQVTVITRELEQSHPDFQGPIKTDLVTLDALSTKQLTSFWELCAAHGAPLAKQSCVELAQLYPLQLSQCLRVYQEAIERPTFESMKALCLQQLSENIGPLASLTRPQGKLSQMVLASETKEQLIEVIDRVMLSPILKNEVVNAASGLQGLFWGKPGTGKTMAAEAIAAQLQLPLYKVNLANIASKWIGETEKHLAQLFDTAERQNAVLLFDEADAIFAKRSEVSSSQDKNANMGVSFLLQRMETYTGLLLLSTNLKNNLDEAFLRRFHAVIEFPMPKVQEREALWQMACIGKIRFGPDVCVHHLAELFEFSPSQIRNITERAILFALVAQEPVISKQHLARAIRRELDKQSAGFMASQKLSSWIAS